MGRLEIGAVDAHGHAEEIPERGFDARVRVPVPIDAEDEVAALAAVRHPDVGDRAGALEVGQGHLRCRRAGPGSYPG